MAKTGGGRKTGEKGTKYPEVRVACNVAHFWRHCHTPKFAVSARDLGNSACGRRHSARLTFQVRAYSEPVATNFDIITNIATAMTCAVLSILTDPGSSWGLVCITLINSLAAVLLLINFHWYKIHYEVWRCVSGQDMATVCHTHASWKCHTALQQFRRAASERDARAVRAVHAFLSQGGGPVAAVYSAGRICKSDQSCAREHQSNTESLFHKVTNSMCHAGHCVVPPSHPGTAAWVGHRPKEVCV